MRITKTVLVTGKDQQYFINKSLNDGERSEEKKLLEKVKKIWQNYPNKR